MGPDARAKDPADRNKPSKAPCSSGLANSDANELIDGEHRPIDKDITVRALKNSNKLFENESKTKAMIDSNNPDRDKI